MIESIKVNGWTRGATWGPKGERCLMHHMWSVTNSDVNSWSPVQALLMKIMCRSQWELIYWNDKQPNAEPVITALECALVVALAEEALEVA